MNKEEFSNQVRERIKQFLPEKYYDAEVIVQEFDVLDEKRCGLAIKQGNPKRIQVLDLEEAFKAVHIGKSMDEVLKEMAVVYTQICSGEMQLEAVVMDADNFLKGVHTQVLNYKTNRDILSNLPYLKINDLVVVPMTSMPDGESIPVPLEVAKGVCESGDLLLAKAMKNHANLLPPILIPLGREPLSSKEFIALDNGTMLKEKEPIYMLTNRTKRHGAAAIADKQILATISRKLGESFYILPCNIHEVAVVPKSYGPNLGYLKELMSTVNQQFVNEGEFLSENIYFYDADRSVVKMFDGKLRDENVQPPRNQDSR